MEGVASVENMKSFKANRGPHRGPHKKYLIGFEAIVKTLCGVH